MCYSFCTDICCCVKTGSYQKLVFGSGIRVTVESSKFYLMYVLLGHSQVFVKYLKLSLPSTYSETEYIYVCVKDNKMLIWAFSSWVMWSWSALTLSVWSVTLCEYVFHRRMENCVWGRNHTDHQQQWVCAGNSFKFSLWRSELIKAKSRNWQNILSKEIKKKLHVFLNLHKITQSVISCKMCSYKNTVITSTNKGLLMDTNTICSTVNINISTTVLINNYKNNIVKS